MLVRQTCKQWDAYHGSHAEQDKHNAATLQKDTGMLQTMTLYAQVYRGVLRAKRVQEQIWKQSDLALMKHCQLCFHVDVVSLATESILQGLFISSPDVEQQGSVCREAVNEGFQDLAVGI